MENVSEEASSNVIRRPATIAEKVEALEKKAALKEATAITEAKKKLWGIPFKWQWKFRQAKSAMMSEQALVLFFNKKNEIEAPQFMPIFSGNMIVYKNKAYAFDPRAIWRLKVKGYPMVYVLKEIDRKPVMNKVGQIYYKDAAISNNDIEEIRMRGDSTESDEFLIKAALKAQTSQIAGKQNWIIGGVILLALVIGVIWFVTKG